MMGWFKDDEYRLRRVMKLRGERHAERLLVKHYQQLAAAIDPHLDWNGYAHYRNLQASHQETLDQLDKALGNGQV